MPRVLRALVPLIPCALRALVSQVPRVSRALCPARALILIVPHFVQVFHAKQTLVHLTSCRCNLPVLSHVSLASIRVFFQRGLRSTTKKCNLY